MESEDDRLAHSTAEKVARRSYGKLVAFLAARSGDVAAAEDALSDAFTAALADWPKRAIPENPAAPKRVDRSAVGEACRPLLSE